MPPITNSPTMQDFIDKNPYFSKLPSGFNNFVTKPILRATRNITSRLAGYGITDGTAFQAPLSEDYNPLLDIVNQNMQGTDNIGGGNANIMNYSPDINGYVFVLMYPPDLSGLTDQAVKDNIIRTCSNYSFFALDFTPPQITINTESINTQASISMPYATTKIATGEMSLSFLDDKEMNIGALHNLWVEYLYNQLWGDFKPADKYITPGNPDFGALDYATTMFIVKYLPNLENNQIPVMVGKATGVFPLGLPTKEPIGVRTSNDLVIQTINYTCSYYEVVHPHSDMQTYSTTDDGETILDEVSQLIKTYDTRLHQYYN